MSSAVKNHPFHMVNPSYWPLVGSIAAISTAIGAVLYMHGGPLIAIAPGFILLLITFYGWCRDIRSESNDGESHTVEVKHGLRMGMVLFITSEVMFFFAFFWAWFHSSVPALSDAATGVWPPEGIVPLETWHLPFINTLILLTSGATLTFAHHALIAGNRGKLKMFLLLTIGLGILFTCLQAFEYMHATFGIADGVYGSAFYLATGFHGFHVIVGTIFLGVCYIRSVKGDFTADAHVGFEAAAWYWHFVDVVWLFLFCTVYWWGSAGYEFAG